MKYEWCRDFYNTKEEAVRAKCKYIELGYEVSDIEPIRNVDEKYGEIDISYELLYCTKQENT